MEKIYMLIMAFVIVYLIYLFLIILNKKGRQKLMTGVEATFLIKVYKIDISKINAKAFAQIIAINNAIIISITFYITGLFYTKAIYQILIAFPFLILLIIFIYSLTGKYLKRKQ